MAKIGDKEIKVLYKNFTVAFGYATPLKTLIELHRGLRGKSELRYKVHELLHLLFPDMSEREVKRLTKVIVDFIWEQGYRKVDNKMK
jgi:hypothetical protein